MPVRYTTLLLATLLFSCSSAPPRPDSPPETGAAPPATKTKREVAPDTRRIIVAFGDSLTAGFGVESGYSYPDFLQKLIDAKDYPWRVVNAGVSGDTTSGGVARLPLVLELKPDIVILELGANDGLRGIPVAATRANLDEMIRSLKGAGAQVVLAGMTLPPNYGADYIKPFEKIFTDLAAEHRVPLIPFLLEGVGGVRALMQQDGLHPTVEGNRKVAENVMEVVEPLLRTAPR
jgi:acyl-CoA thioesterase I